MHIIKNLLKYALCLFPCFSHAAIPLENSEQLIVVVTKNWSAPQGQLIQFARKNTDDHWKQVGDIKPIVVGKNGLAWGIGIHSHIPDAGEPVKKEGDLKAPAGIFSFGTVFGKGTDTAVKMPYLKLTPFIEAVDDPESRYYNQIVDTQDMPPELQLNWKSSEKMFFIPQYELGVVVNHNKASNIPYAGSQIFLHVWRSADKFTTGCTAMSLESMDEIAHWLEQGKNPVLVQMTQGAYSALAQQWQLPALP